MEKNNMTAVEWLVNELKSYTFHERIDMAEWEELKKLSRKAKKIEKDQIKDAIIHNQNGLLRRKTVLEAEQYYNETYGK